MERSPFNMSKYWARPASGVGEPFAKDRRLILCWRMLSYQKEVRISCRCKRTCKELYRVKCADQAVVVPLLW